MSRKTIGVIIVIAVVLSFALLGCAEVVDGEATIPSETGTEIMTAEPSPRPPCPVVPPLAPVSGPILHSVPDSDPFPVSMERVTMDELAELDGFSEYIANPELADNDAHRFIFTAAAPVSDFRLIDVNFDPDAAYDGAFTVGETIHLVGDLTPERPFVIRGKQFNSLPHSGVSFFCLSVCGGITRYFIFGVSGEDGSISMNEQVLR